jgi:hypothetical protein
MRYGDQREDQAGGENVGFHEVAKIPLHDDLQFPCRRFLRVARLKIRPGVRDGLQSLSVILNELKNPGLQGRDQRRRRM